MMSKENAKPRFELQTSWSKVNDFSTNLDPLNQEQTWANNLTLIRHKKAHQLAFNMSKNRWQIDGLAQLELQASTFKMDESW